MRRSDEIFGLPVFSIREGKEVGKVRDAIIDRSAMKVTAFLVEDIAWYGPKILTFKKLQSLGDDALIIESENQLAELKEATHLGEFLDRDLKIIKKKVVSDTGKLIGDISGFQIDVQTGKLGACEIKQYAAPGKVKVIPIEKVLSIGPDVLVIGEKARVIPAPPKKKPRPKPKKVKPKAKPKPKPPKVKVVEKPPPPAPPPVEEKVEAPPPPPPVEEVPKKEEEEAFWGEVKEEERPPRIEEAEEIKEEKVKIKEEEEVVEEEETGVKKVLEEKQDAFLIGKKATKDILADDGSTIIKAGEEITSEVIQKAKEANKYLILNFSAK